MRKYTTLHKEVCFVSISDCTEYGFLAQVEMTEFKQLGQVSWYRWCLFWDMKDP